MLDLKSNILSTLHASGFPSQQYTDSVCLMFEVNLKCYNLIGCSTLHTYTLSHHNQSRETSPTVAQVSAHTTHSVMSHKKWEHDI